MLQGHPDMNKTPGVDVCTGSLGLGVSTACGIALAGKVRKKDYQRLCDSGRRGGCRKASYGKP